MSYRVSDYWSGEEVCLVTCDWMPRPDLLYSARQDGALNGPGEYEVEQFSASGNDTYRLKIGARFAKRVRAEHDAANPL